LPTGKYVEIQKIHSYPFPIKYDIVLIEFSIHWVHTWDYKECQIHYKIMEKKGQKESGRKRMFMEIVGAY